MNTLACFFFQFDAILGEIPPDESLRKQCDELKYNLHKRSDYITDIYDVAYHYAEHMEPKVAGMDAGGMAQCLTSYMKQALSLLHFISACKYRSINLPELCEYHW